VKSHFTSVANGLLANDQRPRIRLNELRVAKASDQADRIHGDGNHLGQ
jgi:hypothetical protein